MRVAQTARASFACGIAMSLAACAASHATIPMPAAPANQHLRPQTSSGFQSLFSFSGTPNGAFPWGGLVSIDGTLYGTTQLGGSTSGSACASTGCGIVFKISKSGSEHVLYRFKGGSDGKMPEGSLTELGGALYGTTTLGGAGCDCGTVFKVSTAGAEQAIYSFKGYTENDGGNPQYNEALLAYKGALYGTTDEGGSSNRGTLYEVTRSGKERVLHTFGLKSRDGAAPTGNLIAYEGTLYGSASSGGRSGGGVVFGITTSGKERIVYNFQGGSDGAGPNSLIAVNGVLYGTTTYGGSSSCNNIGCGTVFAVTTSGKENVIYRFQGGSDGEYPASGTSLVTVTHHKGMLYGTTSAGCPSGGPSGVCGTVFAVSTSGAENTLFNFQFANGLSPSASLLSYGGMLYGTTYLGGTTCYISGGSGYGCGSVFRISP